MAVGVNAAFDRFEQLLPKYVSPRPAMLTAIGITAVAVAVLTPLLRRQARHIVPTDPRFARDTANLVTAVLGIALFRVLFDRLYFLDVFRENKLHFGLLPWVSEYSRAMRA